MDANDEGIEILLVEDNPHEAELTIRSLQSYNLTNRLIHIDDGVDALDFIFARGKYADRDVGNHPRIILLDIKLPRTDGIEILRQIKRVMMPKMVGDFFIYKA